MEASALTPSGALSGLRGPTPLLRLQSDDKLIELTRRGQHAAFETLCSRYESRLHAFCRHMLGSREDAEDVLQEVFAAAFNAVLADSRPINARPWLYRIARNRSLNHLRRASAIGVDSMDVHFADHGMSTSDRALGRESFRELLHDVGQLPETQRTALLLREIDALSYEQIADAMETTVPSVKSLLVRARISLAEAAEARKLSCDEVRLELGHVAEGLQKLTPPVRRHVRDCERCRFFKRTLRENNQVLAAVFPVAPLLLLKKLVLAKLGATASAGSAQVAGGAGATVGAGAGAGAIATAGGATGAAGAGSALTVGAGAIASKAVAGLAAAALVGAGAVAANHLTVTHPARTHAAHPYVAERSEPASGTVVVGVRSQPATLTRSHALRAGGRSKAARHARHLVKPAVAPVAPAASVGATLPATAPQAATTPAAQPGVAETQVTQVTSDTTQLPPQATSPPETTSPAGTTTAGTTEAPAATTPPQAGEGSPTAPAAEAPVVTITPQTSEASPATPAIVPAAEAPAPAQPAAATSTQPAAATSTQPASAGAGASVTTSPVAVPVSSPTHSAATSVRPAHRSRRARAERPARRVDRRAATHSKPRRRTSRGSA